MKPERRIEKFLRRIDVIPDTERKRLGLEKLFEVRDKTKNSTSADMKLATRRIIMNRQIWKCAAAVLFATTLIGVVGIFQNAGQTAYAFDQTVAAMKGKRFFHIQTYYASPTKRHDEFWAEFNELGQVVRVRQLDQWSKEKWPVEVLWENQIQHKYTPGYRRPGILEITKTRNHVDVNKLVKFDPETMIDKINRDVEDGLATVKVDDFNARDGNLVVEVTTTYDPYRKVLHVDPVTKLVLRMDQYDGKDDQGNWSYNRGIEVLEYNEPFDPELFVPNFPPDTITINQLSGTVGMAQGDLDMKNVASKVLRRALKAWATDDYDTASLLFGGAPKEFFTQHAPIKPTGDIDIGEPVFDPIEPGRPRFRINCKYTTEYEGRRTTINKRYWVTTVDGEPGQWYVLHYIITIQEGDDHSDGTDKDMPDTAKSKRFLLKDNNLDYQPISTSTEFYNKHFKLTSLGLAKDDTFLYIKLAYVSPIKSWVGVRLAGDEPGLKEFLTYGTEVGNNLVIVKLRTKKVITYTTHICVEIGDSHSVVIDKDIVDDFITDRRRTGIDKDRADDFTTDTNKSDRFSFKDNNLYYQPISTRTKFRNQNFKLPFLGLAKDENNTHMYIKLVYISPIEEAVGVRLAGDRDISEAHGLSEFLPYGTNVGKNLLIIKLETAKVAAYPTHICVEIGDDHSVVVDKDIVDSFITDTPKSIKFIFKDNNLDYQSIRTPTAFENKDFKINFMGLAKDDAHLYIKLEYDSPIKSPVGIRLGGDKDVSDTFDAWRFLPYGTKVGKNLLIIQLETKKVAKYPTNMCVEIGDEHSVCVRKDIVDYFIKHSKVDRSVEFFFKDNNLDYQPIRTPTEFYNKGFKLPFLGLAKDSTHLYIKLVYISPIKSRIGVRLGGDRERSRAHGLSEFLTYGTEIGMNLLIVRLETKKVAKFPDNICVEIGDEHSVGIKKDIVDEFIKAN
ncbi:MAG: hypothetical protein GY845_22925 [Planctomycetes bacterium]|nr:hypothetical protein [Planctomycetota bacterium]